MRDPGAMHLSSQRQSQTHFTSTVSANGIAAVRSLLGTRVPAIRQRQSVRRRVPGGKYDLCGPSWPIIAFSAVTCRPAET